MSCDVTGDAHLDCQSRVSMSVSSRPPTRPPRPHCLPRNSHDGPIQSLRLVSWLNARLLNHLHPSPHRPLTAATVWFAHLYPSHSRLQLVLVSVDMQSCVMQIKIELILFLLEQIWLVIFFRWFNSNYRFFVWLICNIWMIISFKKEWPLWLFLNRFKKHYSGVFVKARKASCTGFIDRFSVSPGFLETKGVLKTTLKPTDHLKLKLWISYYCVF